MRSVAAALVVFSGELLAHPGHGASREHVHGWGPEHLLLLALVFALLAYSLKK